MDKQDDVIDFDDGDMDDADEFDEHELEIRANRGNAVRWRRIEVLNEQKYLRQQLTDFDDYVF